MKRINPHTNKPFCLGDEREDGFIFYGYTNRLRSNGTFIEIWLNPTSIHAIREKDLARKKAKYWDLTW